MSRLLDALHELLPLSRSIREEFNLTADALICLLNEGGFKVAVTSISQFDIEDWDDERLGEIVFYGHSDFHRGTVLMHTPACSRRGLEDFACNAGGLMQFIRDYDIEMLFDGDVVFLAPESKTLTIFHHEGAFLHVRI